MSEKQAAEARRFVQRYGSGPDAPVGKTSLTYDEAVEAFTRFLAHQAASRRRRQPWWRRLGRRA